MWNWLARLLQKLDKRLHPAKLSNAPMRSNLHGRHR